MFLNSIKVAVPYITLKDSFIVVMAYDDDGIVIEAVMKSCTIARLGIIATALKMQSIA